MPSSSSQTERFHQQVSGRFGVLPNFFCSATAAPGLIEELWGFAKSAYLDNPLPSLLKERLFVYLSRFCPVRYCIVRHVGFLMGLGHPAGDAGAQPQTLEQIIDLLSWPLPDAAALNERLNRLETQPQSTTLPDPGTPFERDLVEVLAVIFLEPRQSGRAREAVKQALGEAAFELLTAYLAFIRTAHYWTETHPELAYEPDTVALMNEHPRLRELLLDPTEAERVQQGEALRQALVNLNTVQQTLQQNQQGKSFILRLSDALRPLADPLAVQETAARLLGEYLGANQVHYGETIGEDVVIHQGWGNGLPPMVGRFRPVDFGGKLTATHRAGILQVVRNREEDPLNTEAERQALRAAQIGAYITVPLIKKGQWVATLAVHSITPRSWTNQEVELIQETAERTWTTVERARAEEALHESERFVQGVIHSLPLVIYIFDLAQRRNRYLSPQVASLFGYTPEQMQVDNLELVPAFFHPDDWARLAAHFERIRTHQPDAEGHPGIFYIEYRIKHRERGWVWVESRDTVYARDADGNPSLLLGTAEDISERRASAQALQESEKRLRLAIEATELATWEWNLATDEVYWNEQHFRLFGMEPHPNPISPDDFFSHVHPSERDRIAHLLERAIAQRGIYDAEFCALLEDGSTRWMSGYGRITEEVDGKPLRMSGVMFDVDERRRAEDALKAADQRKDEFLAMLAHELRNPMATVRNGLNVLSLLGKTDEMTSQTVGMMNRQVDHLVRLVDDLLDVSRISRGKIDLRHERVELGALVMGAVDAVRPQYAAHHKQLHSTPSPSSLFVNGDATRLTQVVMNLLTNGLRYTGGQGQVWISLNAENGAALLRVADNGIGLTADQLTTIFELFVQADNSLARQQGGLGIGLTLVQRLVDMHGGRVEARSPGLGEGSEFLVYLPLLDEGTGEPVAVDAASASQPGRHRLLVIDDNADAALTLAMMLKLKGYEVHHRQSGREGLQAAEALRPTVILCDIGMPEMDGYETCRQIRRQPWGTDVLLVALTGYGQTDDKQRAEEAGFDAHLVKPVDLDVLTSLLTSGQANKEAM